MTDRQYDVLMRRGWVLAVDSRRWPELYVRRKRKGCTCFTAVFLLYDRYRKVRRRAIHLWGCMRLHRELARRRRAAA